HFGQLDLVAGLRIDALDLEEVVGSDCVLFAACPDDCEHGIHRSKRRMTGLPGQTDRICGQYTAGRWGVKARNPLNFPAFWLNFRDFGAYPGSAAASRLRRTEMATK